MHWLQSLRTRLVGFVIGGYRRPAEPDNYVIAQQALPPDFDTVDACALMLTVAVRAQARTGASEWNSPYPKAIRPP
jgi:hypothetical protein